MKYTDAMIDMETLGTTPGAAIMQIAIVLFNIQTGAVSKKYRFNKTLNSDHQIKNGFSTSDSTINWWKKENINLYNELRNSKNNYLEVGRDLQSWYKSLPHYQDIRLWGNSARFDIGILEGFYRKSIGEGFVPFWSSWKERCVRTLFNIDIEERYKIKFEGTKHNAIDDVIHQIKVACNIVKKNKLTLT